MQSQAESNHLNRRLTRNFIAREFICPCCDAEGITDELVVKLQMAHDIYGRVMIVTSGFRCEKHNASEKVRGLKDSAHLTGLAADIRCDNSRHRFLLLSAFIQAGFKRIGIYENFIHVDVDSNKDPEVAWLD